MVVFKGRTEHHVKEILCKGQLTTRVHVRLANAMLVRHACVPCLYAVLSSLILCVSAMLVCNACMLAAGGNGW